MKASQAYGQYVDLLRVATPATPSKADILYQIICVLSRRKLGKSCTFWYVRAFSCGILDRRVKTAYNETVVGKQILLSQGGSVYADDREPDN